MASETCQAHYVGSCDVDRGPLEPSQSLSAEDHFTGRLYYPTDSDAPGPKDMYWITHSEYARGMVEFLFSGGTTIGKRILKAVARVAMYLLTARERLRVRWNADLPSPPRPTSGAASPGPAHPVVVYSHGIGGNRTMYSHLCSALAARGYVVLAIEHHDGTAASARTSAGEFKYYAGWPDKAGQYAAHAYRVAECAAAVDVLKALNDGVPMAGLRLSTGPAEGSPFKGRLDLANIILMGHSYGGATVGAAAAELPLFKGAIALDPWWPAVPGDAACVTAWKTDAPLLIIGSHDWNVPLADGSLRCGDQQRIMDAAASGTAPGATLVVPEGSSHHSFDDILIRFGARFAPFLKLFNFDSGLDPLEGMAVILAAADGFLFGRLGIAPPAAGSHADEAAVKERPLDPEAPNASVRGAEERNGDGVGVAESPSLPLVDASLGPTALHTVSNTVSGLKPSRSAAEIADALQEALGPRLFKVSSSKNLDTVTKQEGESDIKVGYEEAQMQA